MNIPEANGARLAEIPGFPGYVVSDQGEVFCNSNTYRHPNPTEVKYRHLKGGSSRGRKIFCLYKDGKKNYRYVYRLVLEAFIGPCPLGMECCHNDGDHTNNKLDNLRWDTRASNAKDTVKHNNIKTLRQKAITESIAIEILNMLENGISQDKIALYFGISQTTVNKIYRGRTFIKLQERLGRKIPKAQRMINKSVNRKLRKIEELKEEIKILQNTKCDHEIITIDMVNGKEDRYCRLCYKFDFN